MTSQNNTQINFCQMIGGKEYPKEVVDAAKHFIETKTMPDKSKLEKSLIDCLGEAKFQPLEWAMNPFTYTISKAAGEDTPNGYTGLSRLALGICTLGASELLKLPEAAIRKMSDNAKINKFISDVKDCIIALQQEK